MSRWRFAARLAVRSLTRSRRRAALVVAAIALPVLVATTGLTVARSMELTPVRGLDATIGPAAAAFVDAYRWPDLIQSPNGSVAPLETQEAVPIPTVIDHERSLRAALTPDQELHRLTGAFVRWATSDGRFRDGGVLIETALDDDAVAQAVPIAAGNLPTEPGQVVLDHALAAELDVAVGDTVVGAANPGAGSTHAALPQTDLVVSGIAAPVAGAVDRLVGYALPGTALDAPATVGDLPRLRWIVTGDPVSWDQVRAMNAAGSLVISRAVLTDPPPAQDVAFPDPAARVAGGDLVALLLSGVGLLGLTALLVAPAFAVSARRSRREAGLLAAAGARRLDLTLVLGLQGVVAGVTATLAGLVGGVLAAAAVRGAVLATGSVLMPDLRVPWAAVGVLTVIGVAGPALAAWWPARVAAREDPVAALSRRSAPVRPPRARRFAALAVPCVGLLISVAGLLSRSAPVLTAGALVLLGGMLLTLGPLIGRAAAIARRTAAPVRYALRDTERHRSRTVPATAGVLAATAIAIATGGVVTSLEAHHAAVHAAPSGVGTIRISVAELPVDGDHPVLTPTAAQWAAVDATLRDHVELDGAVVPVLAGVAVGDDVGPQGAWIDPVLTAPAPPLRISETAHRATWRPATQPSAPLVDDGTMIGRSNLPGAVDAAAALAAGRVVVAHPDWLDSDGIASFDVAHDTSTERISVPATAVDLGSPDLRLIVPPDLAERFALTAIQVGLLGVTATTPDEDRANDLAVALDAVVPGIGVAVERGPVSTVAAPARALVVGALLLAMASTAMAAALAAADSVPDLATLSAIGARRRVRRAIAAAQTGVITVLGVGVGVLVGMAFVASLVAVRRFGGEGGVEDPTWQLHLPWPVLAAVVLGLPTVAVAGTWFLTPERLPTTRRVAG